MLSLPSARKCKVSDVGMTINGKRYRLAPSTQELGVFLLTNLDEDITYRVQPAEGTCDCPDHLSRGVVCKHLLAILRLGTVFSCVIKAKPIPSQE